MASRCRSLANPSVSLLKSTFRKPAPNSTPLPSLLSQRSSLTFQRTAPQLGSLYSLLPLHSAVSSARLTSCLGLDPGSSRSMCQDNVAFPKQMQEW